MTSNSTAFVTDSLPSPNQFHRFEKAVILPKTPTHFSSCEPLVTSRIGLFVFFFCFSNVHKALQPDFVERQSPVFSSSYPILTLFFLVALWMPQSRVLSFSSFKHPRSCHFFPPNVCILFALPQRYNFLSLFSFPMNALYLETIIFRPRRGISLLSSIWVGFQVPCTKLYFLQVLSNFFQINRALLSGVVLQAAH